MGKRKLKIQEPGGVIYQARRCRRWRSRKRTAGFLDRTGAVVSSETKTKGREAGAGAEKCVEREPAEFPLIDSLLHEIRGRSCRRQRAEVEEALDDGCGEGSGQRRIEKRDRAVQRHEGPAGRKAVAACWPLRCVPGLPQRLGGAGVWSRD